MTSYAPWTYWSQDVNTLHLRIDLINVETYQLSVFGGGRFLNFSAKAFLHQEDEERSEFTFTLPLVAAVLALFLLIFLQFVQKILVEVLGREFYTDFDSFDCIRTDRNLSVTLKKQNAGFWKNGILDPEYKKGKLNFTFLKFNFDKWKDDPDDEEEEDVDDFFEEEEEERITKKTAFEKLLKQLENTKDESISKMENFYKNTKILVGILTIFIGVCFRRI
ncbi:CS domain-containing protein [Meloidogyne graminicola]|uniref:CS domain-containing protein n=1 Tax=Meloidogyne graminicola TaxID=189291 RepID=A0A8S9ZMW3_9BILA|nr:CS domain-containing protein [Meloidogyne graminicola]